VPVGELLGSLAGAVVEGMVDGVVEDPVGEYFAQLEATRAGLAVAEPPQPHAQVILTVPVLGLLGATNEPAVLAGHGPIDEVTARKLLGGAGSFLRVLTDPVTAEPLKGVPPERYRLRDAEKALLRALAETCSFPGCTNPALDTETDHLTAYALGGPTTPANSHALCKRHHAYKHFRDDKDKHGRHRQDLDPDRAAITLRGWTPNRTPDGRVGWTSPTGKYHPPEPRTTEPPAYPKWLKKQLTQKPGPKKGTSRTTTPGPAGTTTPGPARTGPAPRFDLRRSPLENLLTYKTQPHQPG
ncbi:HNH endonuclease signature motif containing protein, partial [Arthrobacter silviterrae]